MLPCNKKCKENHKKKLQIQTDEYIQNEKDSDEYQKTIQKFLNNMTSATTIDKFNAVRNRNDKSGKLFDAIIRKNYQFFIIKKQRNEISYELMQHIMTTYFPIQNFIGNAHSRFFGKKEKPTELFNEHTLEHIFSAINNTNQVLNKVNIINTTNIKNANGNLEESAEVLATVEKLDNGNFKITDNREVKKDYNVYTDLIKINTLSPVEANGYNISYKGVQDNAGNATGGATRRKRASRKIRRRQTKYAKKPRSNRKSRKNR